MKALDRMQQELQALQEYGNLRTLPLITHQGREVVVSGRQLLNLSSNDYLGLANDLSLRKEFWDTLCIDNFLTTASSSRLLTGNFGVYNELEELLASLFEAESALVFNSGYHANMGILPAISDVHTLILADKLVHASLIDGIRLSTAKCIRYQHANYEQLERLLHQHQHQYQKIIIVTESIFSMDGDVTNLGRLVKLKHTYPHVLLYVDEAHAFGVRGMGGLGCAQEQGCMHDIDLLVGTFGKAIASTGAYIICKQVIRNYLINKMRTFIFTTALPPITVSWTLFVVKRLAGFRDRRERLSSISQQVKQAIENRGYASPSGSHIIPLLVGDSSTTILKAEQLQRKGFYVLPIRPPTVPQGSSRLRLSLTADIKEVEVQQLINAL